MTKAQENAVERIRKLVIKECRGIEEIKVFDVTEYETFVSVYVVYGLIDEKPGTLAFLARDYAHLFIGKRGGIRFPVTSKKGNQYCLPFHGYSILEAVVKQYH